MAIVVSKPKLNLLERLYIFEAACGMAVTLKHFFRNLLNPHRLPTLNYPEQKRMLPPNFRGLHRLLKREDGGLKCVACKLCVAACPAKCIVVEAGQTTDPKPKRYPVRYEIDISRCIFCGYCVEACPFEAIDMKSGIYELADADLKNFQYNKEKLSS
jgi:NADH-quinone oxidoreductase subunit I